MTNPCSQEKIFYTRKTVMGNIASKNLSTRNGGAPRGNLHWWLLNSRSWYKGGEVRGRGKRFQNFSENQRQVIRILNNGIAKIAMFENL